MKGALLEPTDNTYAWTKDPARHTKHGGGMMLLTVLVRRINHGKSGHSETQLRRTLRYRKRLGGLLPGQMSKKNWNN